MLITCGSGGAPVRSLHGSPRKSCSDIRTETESQDCSMIRAENEIQVLDLSPRFLVGHTSFQNTLQSSGTNLWNCAHDL